MAAVEGSQPGTVVCILPLRPCGFVAPRVHAPSLLLELPVTGRLKPLHAQPDGEALRALEELVRCRAALDEERERRLLRALGLGLLAPAHAVEVLRQLTLGLGLLRLVVVARGARLLGPAVAVLPAEAAPLVRGEACGLGT